MATSPIKPQTQMSSSSPIPLPSSHTHRTRSEHQLADDKEIAKMAETVMFQRLVHGMMERQKGLDLVPHQDPPAKPTLQSTDLPYEKTHALSSVLRRASELCSLGPAFEVDGVEEETDQGIFLMDDM